MIIDIPFLILIPFIPSTNINVDNILLIDLIVSIMILILFILNSNLRKKYGLISIFSMIPFVLVYNFFSSPEFIWVSLLFSLSKIFVLLYFIFKIKNSFVKFIRKTNLDYGIVYITTVFFLGSILFYIFELKVNPNISSFNDVLWYMTVTITTTGYGDITPVTSYGRLIGIITMLSGVGFASLTTASVASDLLNKMKLEREKVRTEVSQLVKKRDKTPNKNDDEIKELLIEISKKLDEK
ncbi:MAG: ion channel [Methanobacteriaceae archaeon]|nr:ion channel [Methanobacteriaceae archaeon]